MAIHAVGGMAGTGKTTLAAHPAHKLAPSFPDGRICLPLHAHTPGRWYLEIFHNLRRRHSSLGMLTPIEYELRANSTEAVA